MNFLLLISLLINFYGYFSDSPVIVTFAQIILCLSFVVDHYKKYKLNNINPIFVFSIGSLYTAYGHFLAFYNIKEKEEAYFQYFKYSVPENYTEAMEIYFIGILFIVLGFNSFKRSTGVLPEINFTIKSISVLNYLFYLSFFIVIFQGFIVFPGPVQRLVSLIPISSIFLLNLFGITYKVKNLENYSWILVFICTINSFFTSYLRFDIISPAIIYLISSLMATKRVRSFFDTKYIPIFALILFFSFSFNKLGMLRTIYSFSWQQKVSYLFNNEQVAEFEDEQKKQTILARSTVINQLTQVIRVKKEDGLYSGKTMLYLTYVFIPRFVWPEKPIIQQGGWFAERIGLAYRNDSGSINNSINMTIYGEAYLNFEYYGVIIISFLFGYFIAQLWQASGMVKNYFNILGVGFSLYLIGYATFQLGADIQAVVTILSVYLIFLFSSIVLKELYR